MLDQFIANTLTGYLHGLTPFSQRDERLHAPSLKRVLRLFLLSPTFDVIVVRFSHGIVGDGAFSKLGLSSSVILLPTKLIISTVVI